MVNRKLKILISGGGTGGHIFPAIAIADEIRARFPEAEFLFIGANGKMEMEKVPEAGYPIEGLTIRGFDRGNLLRNFSLPFKLLGSLIKARKIIKNFQPDFAVGTGGFASGPALYMAAREGVPIFVQEQNSLPGKTNIFLARKAKAVYTAYPAMQKFFGDTPAKFLGNPVRKSLLKMQQDRATAKKELGLAEDRLTLLSVGGSLGSRAINTVITENLDKILAKNYQLLWQTGRLDYQDLSVLQNSAPPNQLRLMQFIDDMPKAYAAADVIISRAGAIAVSELALAAKPVLLVPFPYAAEDHQTRNASVLADRNAAKMVKDADLQEDFIPTLFSICENETLRKEMAENIRYFARPDATKDIVEDICQTLDLAMVQTNKAETTLKKEEQQ